MSDPSRARTVPAPREGVGPVADQSAQLVAMGAKPGEDITPYWFRMKYFDDVAGYYKHLVRHVVTDFFTADRVAGKQLLDFGCGPGFYSATLAQRGAIVTGIDLSAFLIGKANEHKTRLGFTNLTFLEADFIEYCSRMESDAFDYVRQSSTIQPVGLDRRRGGNRLAAWWIPKGQRPKLDESQLDSDTDRDLITDQVAAASGAGSGESRRTRSSISC